MSATRPRAHPPTRRTPAQRALDDAGLDVRAVARWLEVKPEYLERVLRANHCSHGMARLLASVTGAGIWCFHWSSLEREREEQR